MPISPIITSNNRGFTLVELTVVVFVIALTTSLVLPLVSNVSDVRIHSVGRRLAGTIKYLYNEAVLEKKIYRLTFDLDHATYLAERQERDGEWSGGLGRMEGIKQLPGTVIIPRVYINGRGSFTSGKVSMQIYPAGWLDETVLYLQDGKYKKTLRISALTGTTEFYDGYREF